jgi:hypothetical protein
MACTHIAIAILARLESGFTTERRTGLFASASAAGYPPVLGLSKAEPGLPGRSCVSDEGEQMARPYGSGRATCESCIAIDVRRWHRDSRLRAGQYFSWSWTCGGEPSGDINVRTEASAVVLMYRYRGGEDAEWRSVEQRVPITWTACHLGGCRPWFICSAYSRGRYCGRRVALLYGASELFACRHCYGLAYASQQESTRYRDISRSRKIRMQLGGSANLLDPFPNKPRRMHWRTYQRLRARAAAAEGLSNAWLMQSLRRLKRR